MIGAQHDGRDASHRDVPILDQRLSHLEPLAAQEADRDLRARVLPIPDEQRNTNNGGGYGHHPHQSRNPTSTLNRRRGKLLFGRWRGRRAHARRSQIKRGSKLNADNMVTTTTAQKKAMPGRGSAAPNT